MNRATHAGDLSLYSCRRQENPLPTSHFCGMQAACLTTATRLGVLGGSFDPIHHGHLAIAEEARVRCGLDAVLFIPAGEPPHKAHGLADAEQRFLMVTLATAGHPAFFVSRLEIDRPGPSYTVETLRELRAVYPQAALSLLIGADMALDFHAWRDPEAILALAEVVAASRPGFPIAALRETPTGARLTVLPVPGLEISSTELRGRVATGRSLRYLTPDPVVDFIAKAGLYR